MHLLSTHALCCFCLCAGSFLVSAQNFRPLPGPLLTQEVELEAANERFIYLENLTSDTLRLRWRVGEVSKPEEWDMDLCDYGLCYAGIPNSGTMNPIWGATRAYLKLIVQPDTFPGEAWVWFRVWEQGHDSAWVDVYFSLHTAGVVSAPTAMGSASIEWKIYPNPARDVLYIQAASVRESNTFTQVLDSRGQVMWSGDLTGDFPYTLETAQWPRGLYFLQAGQTAQPFVLH